MKTHSQGRTRRLAGIIALLALGAVAMMALGRQSPMSAPPVLSVGETKNGASIGKQPLVEAARQQIGVTTGYDPAYVTLPYPMGDVPAHTGVCADVIVRAFRRLPQGALDLQQAVHNDMQGHFHHYPKRWGMKQADRNIDHRRVLNLMTYFQRRGWALTTGARATDYQAGDIVAWLVNDRLPHIGIISDHYQDKVPLVIHNIGEGVKEEDILFKYPVIGHFRLPELKQKS